MKVQLKMLTPWTYTLVARKEDNTIVANIKLDAYGASRLVSLPRITSLYIQNYLLQSSKCVAVDFIIYSLENKIEALRATAETFKTYMKASGQSQAITLVSLFESSYYEQAGFEIETTFPNDHQCLMLLKI